MGNDICTSERGPDTEEDKKRKQIIMHYNEVSEVDKSSKNDLREIAKQRLANQKPATAEDLKDAFRSSLRAQGSTLSRKKQKSLGFSDDIIAARDEEDIKEEKKFMKRCKVKIDAIVKSGYNHWGEKDYDAAQTEFERARDESLKALSILKDMDDKKRKDSKGQTHYRWKAAVKLLKEYLARAYGNLARCMEGKNDNAGAIKNYYPCLKLVKQLGDRDRMAKVYNNVAVSYLTMGDFGRSLHFHEKTLDMYKSLNRDTESLEKRIKFIRDRRAAEKAIRETQDEVKATMESVRLEEERKVDEALSL